MYHDFPRKRALKPSHHNPSLMSIVELGLVWRFPNFRVKPGHGRIVTWMRYVRCIHMHADFYNMLNVRRYPAEHEITFWSPVACSSLARELPAIFLKKELHASTLMGRPDYRFSFFRHSPFLTQPWKICTHQGNIIIIMMYTCAFGPN